MYKRLRPLSYEERLTLQTDIKGQDIFRVTQSVEKGSGTLEDVGGCPALLGLGVWRAAASRVKMCTSEDATFPGPRTSEGSWKCTIAPQHVRPLPLGKWAGCSWAHLSSGPGIWVPSQGSCLSGRGRQGGSKKSALLGVPPKDQDKALDTARAQQVSGSASTTLARVHVNADGRSHNTQSDCTETRSKTGQQKGP